MTQIKKNALFNKLNDHYQTHQEEYVENVENVFDKVHAAALFTAHFYR